MTDPNKINEYTGKVRLHQCLTDYYTYLGFMSTMVSAYDVAEDIHLHIIQIRARIETLAGEMEKIRTQILVEKYDPSGDDHDRPG